MFCALALASTFLALRAAPVGFNDRGADDLRALAEQIDGGSVVFLGVDRFAGYWLRGTLAESPGGYVPQDVDARPEKTWQQGLAMDFDTLEPVEARQLRLRDHDRCRVCVHAAAQLRRGRARGRLRPVGADRGDAAHPSV